MKKIILVVLILILAMLCLTSCQDGNYAELNQISKNNYNQVQIDVTVQKSGESSALVSSFKVLNADETKQIEYSLQEYAKFDVNGAQISAPESQIVTKTGTVVVENGQITSQTGDQTNLDFAKVGELNFNFSDSCLFGAQTANGIFTAHVTSLTKFCGQNISGASNVKVTVDGQK
jgi:hypothetical protein